MNETTSLTPGRAVAGPEAGVHQGDAVASILFSPPPWLEPALSLLAFVAVGGAAVAYRRHGFPRDAQAEMLRIAYIVGACYVATISVVNWADVSYVESVLGGWLGGAVVSLGSLRGYRLLEARGVVDVDERFRIQVAGWLLAWAAIYVPDLIAGLGRGFVGMTSWQVRLPLVGLGALLVIVNAADE